MNLASDIAETIRWRRLANTAYGAIPCSGNTTAKSAHAHFAAPANGDDWMIVDLFASVVRSHADQHADMRSVVSARIFRADTCSGSPTWSTGFTDDTVISFRDNLARAHVQAALTLQEDESAAIDVAMDLVWEGGALTLDEAHSRVSGSGSNFRVIRVRDLVRSSQGVSGSLRLNGMDVSAMHPRWRPVYCSGYLSASLRSSDWAPRNL